MSRNKKLVLNAIMALLKQFVALICGFILPKYILKAYGSEVNGLISSITQFLAFISFLEMGVGPVIQSNLYKPLAEKDSVELSRIYSSGKRFFRRIASIFLVYIVVLICIFPYIADSKYGHMYSGTLIVIISISTFAQYYFGMMNQLLLNADQKAYIQFALNTGTIVLNTIFSVVLIKFGMSIQLVKLSTALLYLLRPIIMMLYVNKHYEIDKDIIVEGEPIRQKWNGFAQHMAAVVVCNTDVTVLTIFSSLTDVSIYSVYYMIINGITDIVMNMTAGMESMWGQMLAKKEYHALEKSFFFMEWLIHTGVTFLFSVTALLIVPFVQVYTKEITDVNYVVPFFALMLVAAYGIRCLRVPYFKLIKAAGHYKQTQNGSIIQMTINIVVSVLLVFQYGLVGVGIGTLFAMFYHTTYFAWYLRKNILCRPFKYYIGYLTKDFFLAGIIYVITSAIKISEISYLAWIIMAVKVTVLALIPTIVLNVKHINEVINFMRKKLGENEKKIRNKR